MCGIVGFWGSTKASSELALKMAEQIRSRGPDDAGVWRSHDGALALAHRRLSIIDLSPAGHQPMLSPCGSYALVFNGEIYNHLDLRSELEADGGGFVWRGHSDTETLLAALLHWGLRKTLSRLNGMFAFAFWDESVRTLFLARDRMGEKPLYYGRSGKSFLFGSELKALIAHPDWCGEIDRDSLALFMRHSYVPSPFSIYQGIAKLSPAHYVAITDNGRTVGQPICYWDISQVAERGIIYPNASEELLIDKLDSLLRDAVKSRMTADVPLGAFLSGGYDSSIVAALMQAQSPRPVKTFSIGFFESSFNEAQHAKAVANHLGTEHTEFYVTPEEAMSIIPSLPHIYDEPFSDSSQIPTYLVSKLAREQVTVSLSGDGGDELFCGYNRYVMGYQVWSKLRLLPNPIRQALAGMLKITPGSALNAMQALLPKRFRVSNLTDRLPKLATVLAHDDGESFYRGLVSHSKEPNNLVIGGTEPNTILTSPVNHPKLPDFREKMMFLDMVTYLPDDILTKVDRASMAVSLEARVPLLDHRLVEFAWQVPIKYKYRDRQGKWLLRQVLYKYLPRELMDRPKMGFGVPIEQWLRGPLRHWAEELLDEKRLREEGFFNPLVIRNMWGEHLSGHRRWHYHLWDVLMFQAWLEKTK